VWPIISLVVNKLIIIEFALEMSSGHMISIIFTNLQDDKICQVSYRWWQSAHYRSIIQISAHPPPPSYNC
jgi:hypothetical protein